MKILVVALVVLSRVILVVQMENFFMCNKKQHGIDST